MHPKALLDACAEIVRLSLQLDHPADATVSRYFREHRSLGPRERATLAETVYTVLRKKLLFEHMARSGSGARERRLAILGFHGPRDFLKSALTDAEKNWLDQCDSVQPGDLMERHRHNLPEWLVPPLKEQLGDAFWPLVDSLNQGATLDLRVNTFTDKRAEVRKELAAVGIKSALTPYSPWGLRIDGKPALTRLDAFVRGAIEVQDEGSQLLALLLDAGRGEMVVDFCAGAGGKTLAIGAAMRSTGRLYAFDTSAHRLDALKPRLARSKLSNVHPAAIAHERDDRVKRLAGKIDRVLVDAPCSGLGTLRRNPDLKWRQSPQSVEEMTVKQAAILQSAARLLKPGGRLVYATCSVLPQENEAIALAFTAANKDFTPLEARDILIHLKVDGAASLCSGPASGGEFLRLWPHRHGTDGFFAAVWQRNAV
jgi:16S rRNA (cytosine967-C5)-methyltransferase